ncbi:T9SS type A sorting domain-containing protein [Flavobacterium paronense]|uniref:T9SS type A sorting domain-containing protein n=1 Tax=Flavobacterium paronense TaxID=1392775 RepID=A0ABV5GIY1_9FLAO|nr:T9SS type A sorting domain-containing protein [Flavobacterium paronense]MDN3676454.1 T9SS type A sorting domain-containing protein [Flavobacterium paronense]
MKHIYSLLICCFFSIAIYSQNDLCDNAITVTPTLTCISQIAGTFNGATISSAAPSCAPNSSQDVWYKFVATDKTMNISVGIASNSFVNIGLEILQNNCTGTSIACVNLSGINLGENYFNNDFIIGETYYLRVFNVSSGLSAANFTLCTQTFPAPANDECATATTVTPTLNCVSLIQGAFSGATISSAAPSCAPNSSQDVWYQFVATDVTMSIALGVAPNSFLNAGMEVLQNNCNGTSILCLNASGVNIGETYFNNDFIIGETYYVRVFNVSSGFTTANFTLCVQKFPPPANDECINATTLTPSINCLPINATYSGATIGSAPPNCAPNSSQDVWFKFIATDATMNITLGPTSTLDIGFEVLQNNCTGTSIACVNALGAGFGENYFSNEFIVGETYYVRVLNASTGFTTANYFICVQKYQSPANDLCANAIQITENNLCNGTLVTMGGALRENTLPSCALNASQDVWYKFTALTTAATIYVGPDLGIDNGFEIYDGSCTGTAMHCVNQGGFNTSESNSFIDFVIGNTYYIRVFNASATISTSTFTVCVYDPTLGLSEVQNYSFKVYPNPAFDFVTILNATETIQSIQIYNQLGQFIKNGTLIGDQLDIRDLQTGLYYIKISKADTSEITKLIKR